MGSEPEAVVFLVSADPEPRDDIAFTQTKRSIMFADANDTNPVTAFLEVQGRMIRIPLPECVLFAR